MRSLLASHKKREGHAELVSASHHLLATGTPRETSNRVQYRTKLSGRAASRSLGKAWLIAVFFVTSLNTFAQSVPPRPSPPRLVNNLSTAFPNFISAEEEQMLEKKLENFSNETSNQICIVIIDSLWGFGTSDLAERIMTTWGVGKKDKNNGVVILIKPTGGPGQRDAFIGTGYGLEGAIPDVTCKKIVDNELIPNFKNGDNYKALDEATTVLMALAKGEYNSKDYSKRVGGRDADNIPWWVWVVIVVIILIVMRKRGGGGGGYTYTGSGWGGSSWGGSSWGGGGWSSGSSGGGWGGFGGGSGGGGGAGGKW